MADSKAFEVACVELERATSFTGLEARGTIRIALKKSGLTAATVTATEMDVSARMVLPKELTLRGVDDADEVANRVSAALSAADLGDESRPDSPEAVFSRLGG
jgi:hypothetical protein